ncbi:uncharacterized protein [Spinacia oleracea]|uniref:Uncharacterized protein n=1 Tax=Spinacia oleracea TaxID=3562 RepID=A0A9R0JJP2_SPIOL|nr:uncharacterized protein LOC110776988 [Spinacia oleracea]
MSRTAKLVALMNIARPRKARKAGHQHRHMSQFSAVQAVEYHQELEKEDIDCAGEMCSKKGNWVPHPRSGIYFPEGQDWVLNDVPENSASLGQSHTYWLRNVYGVEKHDPDMLSADHYFLTEDHA